jgi:type II secretory pathway pseudopilin PulG
MDLPPKQPPQPRRDYTGRAGYSLVELLLTMSLLLLFTGLAVVSLNSLNQQSALTEGAIRFETLLRYARAEAAHSGKRVRLTFVQDTNQPTQLDTASRFDTNQVDNALPLNHVELTWEPNPVDQPDVFQDLQTIQWGVDQVNETVGVSAVRLVEDSQSQSATNEMDQAPLDYVLPEGDYLASLPSITFNPNGSCDSADITLADREGREDRRVVVRLEGFTGSVWRLDPADKDTDATPDARQPSDPPSPARSGQSN